jgi:hypothetical protein
VPRTHICAQSTEICQLAKDAKPDTKLLEKYFSHFAKNFRMPNLYAKLLEMLSQVFGYKPIYNSQAI